MEQDDLWLNVAHAFSKFSEDPVRKVGAVLVRDGKLICYDWNRALPSAPIKNWDDRALVNAKIQHAEIGALSHFDCRGGILYVTKQPCESCEKVIKAKGVRVVWKEIR